MEEVKKNTESESVDEKIDLDDVLLDEIEMDDEDTGEQDSNNNGEEPKEPKEEIDWQDKFVRLHAEWDNYRKRMDEQRADERARATERLMSDLLVCVDDMSRTIDYATEHGEGDLLDGVVAVNNKFRDVLEKHGLVEIDPAGQAFDPLIAQAVGTVEDASVFDETVKDVYQKGYRLGIKVLRPAMVTITSGGEKSPVESDDDAKVKTSNDEASCGHEDKSGDSTQK